MSPTASEKHSRFGFIAFGTVGLLFGIVQVVPWARSDAIFLNSVGWKWAWAFLYAIPAALFGCRFGTHFVQTARSGDFSRAGALMIPALFLSAVVFCFCYFIAIVIAGDFGQSSGIFGSFNPTTLPQKLAGAAMVAVIRLLRMTVSTVIIGFLTGYLLALVFDQEWKKEKN